MPDRPLGELPHSALTLQRAERVLADQRSRVGPGQSFNDYVPYVFDCAAAIGRVATVETEPVRAVNQGMRTWWKALSSDLANEKNAGV